MRLDEYLSIDDITYDQYVNGVNEGFSVDEGFKEVKDKAVAFIGSKVKEASTEFDRISQEFGLSFVQIGHALAERDMFKLMKAFGFSFKTILKSLHDLTGILRQGLFSVFEDLHKTKVFQQYRSGIAKWDDVTDAYPILKKITGPMVAALLFFMWTQMTFIGNVDYDFDFTNITAALKGSYTLEDIFGSPQGLMFLALFASGSLISVPWLGKTTYNLAVALVYTGLKKAGAADRQVMQKLRARMSFR